MTDSNRKQRPPVERIDPLRAWLSDEPPRSGEVSNGAPPPGAEGEGEPSGAREASYRAVNNAYRLIDEYLRQGQKMAENLWLPDTAEKVDEAAPMRFMRAMGDMTMAWVEVMQQWTTNAGAQPAGAVGPFTAGRAPSPAGAGAPQRAAALKVSVKARGQIDVSVHLGDAATVESLAAGELRPFEGDAAPIRDVTVTAASGDEPPVLRIAVPDDQPPGTYNGLLVDVRSRKPRGTISLTLS